MDSNWRNRIKLSIYFILFTLGCFILYFLQSSISSPQCPKFHEIMKSTRECTSQGGVVIASSMDVLCCQLWGVDNERDYTWMNGSGLNVSVQYFQSQDYPEMSTGNVGKVFKFIPSWNFKGIRLTFIDWKITNESEGVDSCEFIGISLKGFIYQEPEEMCGDLNGYSVLIDRNFNSEGMSALEIHIVVVSDVLNYKWKIQILQIPESGNDNVNVNHEYDRKEARFVINGVDTDISNVPWQASIRDMSRPPAYARRRNCTTLGRHFCSGSIISPHYLLSAAHCFSHWSDMRSLSSLQIVIGESTTCLQKTINEGKLSEQHEIETVILHYGFNNSDFRNDIAVIKLKRPINYNANIRAIQFWKGEIITGASAHISGWGRTNHLNSETSYLNNLQYGNVTIQSMKVCKEEFELFPTDLNESKSILCSKPTTDSSSSIGKGDSGGGLFFRNDSSKKSTLIGVVSFILSEKNMSYFQSTSFYSTWINLALQFQSFK